MGRKVCTSARVIRSGEVKGSVRMPLTNKEINRNTKTVVSLGLRALSASAKKV